MVRNQARNSDTIGGLAKAAGVGVETVRYYQRRGLLPEPPRPHGEVRRYGDDDVRRLRFIRSAQAAGFTLDEIDQLLRLDADRDQLQVREMALARLAILDKKVEALMAAREELVRLTEECRATEGQGPCVILQALTH